MCARIIINIYQNLTIPIFTEKLQIDYDMIILKNRTQPVNKKGSSFPEWNNK